MLPLSWWNKVIYINALCQWADAWQLSISVEKSCILSIGKTVPSTPLSVNGASLPYVSSRRDLGVIVASDLTHSGNINDIVFKALQQVNAIHRCFSSRNSDLLVRAYRVYVRPLLEYYSVIWSPHLKCDIKAIERVQRRFTKRLHGYHKDSKWAITVITATEPRNWMSSEWFDLVLQNSFRSHYNLFSFLRIQVEQHTWPSL